MPRGDGVKSCCPVICFKYSPGAIFVSNILLCSLVFNIYMRGRVYFRENIMSKKIIASLLAQSVALAFATPSYSAENIDLDEVTVKANRFEHKDTETTYASEVHTAKQIEASGAATLYDFLAQQSSVTVLPYFGNKASPSLDIRGYGSENGFQNIVITVDGQRLNNIDLTPQLIGAIPLGNIERIEIRAIRSAMDRRWPLSLLRSGR